MTPVSGLRPTPGLLVAAAVALLMVGAGPSSLEGQRIGEGMAIMKPDIMTFVGFDELEYYTKDGEGRIEYDSDIWIGGDIHRAWFRARGEQLSGDSPGQIEVQALYSRAVASFWNTQAGFRVDGIYGSGTGEARSQLAVGVAGLAPYWFEFEAFGFVSQDGDVSGRLEASYEVLLTQRLIVESEIETLVSAQSVPEWAVGRGFNHFELGARMRYEFKREFAPYVGYSWKRRFGETADFAALAGEETRVGAFVFGLHWWW